MSYLKFLTSALVKSYGIILALMICLVMSYGESRALAAPEESTGSFLVRKGEPEAVIVIGKTSSPDTRFVAAELQRYLQKLSQAQLSIVSDDNVPAGKIRIVLGGPEINSLSRLAEQKQLVSFAGLKPEGFVLKAVELDGQPAIIVGGNDEAGTMYAAYDFLERLGIVFQLNGDIIPDQKPDLAVPTLDARTEPMAKYRGIMVEHGFGSWYMGLKDYCGIIDQMAKLKLNFVQFTFGMGSPFLKFSYDGKVGEVVTTRETHYTAWGRTSRSFGESPHSTTGTIDDIKVGREVFGQEYAGPPDFANVQTPDDAFAVAREFLRGLIRHAHLRHVQVCLLPQELSYVPPNLANLTREQLGSFEYQYQYQRYCGVAMPPGDPATLDIWEAAMRTMIETYPEADAYGFWTTEHSPDMRDPAIQDILRTNATERALLPSVEEIRKRGNVMVSTPAQLDSDFLQMFLSQKLIERVKKAYPAKQLAVMTLFRGYKMAALDSMLPKDVWLGNMEECGTTGPVMSFYGGITNRELFVIPRLSDDGDEFHMQLNAGEFDQDEIVTGAAKYGVAGIVGQLIHPRNIEYNIRYLAEGAWDPGIRPQSFYERYLSQVYGPAALDPVLKAFLLLEKNEKALVYWGRSETFVAFMDFSPLSQLRTNVDYRSDPLTVTIKGRERLDEAANESMAKKTVKKLEREELTRAISATWGEGPFWKWRTALKSQHAADFGIKEGEFYRDRAAVCRQALELFHKARPKVLPGARAELDYVIYKTDTFASYLNVLAACNDATVTLDRAWLGLMDRDWAEFGARLNECQESLNQAQRLAKEVAGQMMAYADVPEEKYLLLRFNRNVIAPIDVAQEYVGQVIAYQEQQSRLEPNPKSQTP
jgi:hypothetical protein